MGRKSKRGVIVCGLIAAVTVVAFQNCARISYPDDGAGSQSLASREEANSEDTVDLSKLTMTAASPLVPDGQSASIALQFSNVIDVSVFCKDAVTNDLVFGAMVEKTGQQIQVTVDRDLNCVASGTAVLTRHPIQTATTIQVACGARVKNLSTNRCE